MDYLKKIEESLKFTWKYKTLWIFGLILSIFSGGGGNFPSNSNFDETDSDKINTAYDNFFDEPWAIVLVLGIVFFIIVLALLGWYLSSISKAALINSVVLDAKGELPTFRKGWAYGRTQAFRIMWMDVLSFLISLIIVIPIVITVLLGIVFPPFFALFCLLVPFIIVFAVLWEIVYTGAQRYLVLRNMSAWSSIKSSWELTKKTISDYLVGWFVGCLAGCVWAIVLVPVSLLLGVSLLAVFVIGMVANPILGILILVFGLILLVLFLSTIDAPYRVFSHTYWTKVVMELMEKYDKELVS